MSGPKQGAGAIRIGSQVTMMDRGRPFAIVQITGETDLYWKINRTHYSKSDFMRIWNPDSGPKYSIAPATEEHRQEIRVQSAGYLIQQTRWNELPGALIVRIADLLREPR